MKTIKDRLTGEKRRYSNEKAKKMIEESPEYFSYSTKGAYQAQEKLKSKFNNRSKKKDNPFGSKLFLRGKQRSDSRRVSVLRNDQIQKERKNKKISNRIK